MKTLCVAGIVISTIGLTHGIIGGNAVTSAVWAGSLALWVVNLVVNTVWP